MHNGPNLRAFAFSRRLSTFSSQNNFYPCPKYKKYWKMSREYDFSEYQMEADEALLKLGLARKGVDPDYPEDGDVMLYGPKP